jgi:hypothetical protein
MNVHIQFGIAESGHVGFPLLAEGRLFLPDQLYMIDIVEYGRTPAECLERVYKFTRMLTANNGD